MSASPENSKPTKFYTRNLPTMVGSAFLLGGVYTIFSVLFQPLVLLNSVLFQSKLVPRWLSGWGLVGATLSFVTYLLQVFSINITDIIFAPIAVQEMAFAVWLIVKGFNSSAIASES